MARFAPFEPSPTVAVAVSGGADSMALAWLAGRWARQAGGRTIGLIVDHGLRPEAADEAARAAAWLTAMDIEAHVLTVSAAPPATGNVQAWARDQRYHAMEEWCRAQGVLHLLVGHHADDQAETVLQRLARGSGVHGLSAMTPCRMLTHVRVLRPLLSCARAALRRTLQAAGQDWLDDPSNEDERFDRVRLRKALASLAPENAVGQHLADSAAALQRARAALDTAVSACLASAVTIDPAGYAWLLSAPLCAAPDEVAHRAMTQLLACIGGGAHPSSQAAVARVVDTVRQHAGGARTLAGCRLVAKTHGWLICRENRRIPAPLTLQPGDMGRWDKRFVCRLDSTARGPMTVRARQRGDRLGSEAIGIPGPARAGVPVVEALDGRIWLPHLYRRADDAGSVMACLSVAFAPHRPLSEPLVKVRPA